MSRLGVKDGRRCSGQGAWKRVGWVVWVAGLLFRSLSAQVPHHIEFGDLNIRFTSHARHEIEAKMKKLTQSSRGIAIKVARAKQYFPLIEEALAAEGVPLDFKYLVLQESALISDAVSSSQAVGFWQFKDFTAHEVGLRLDKKVDARMHIVASTRGAARYLKQNNFYFDNWMYALTAYYTGRGGAEKFVKEKHMGKKSMRITRHEHWYIKTFIAHLLVFEKAIEESNVQVSTHLLAYYDAKGDRLSQVAREFHVSEEKMRQYNKWLRRGRIPEGEDLPVIVPLGDAGAASYIAEYSKDRKKGKKQKPLVSKASTPTSRVSASAVDFTKYIEGRFLHQVKVNGLYAIVSHKHDNLNTLCIKGEISENKLLRYNDLSPDHQVKPGQLYYLQPKRSRASAYYHTAKPRETLWDISQRYGIKFSSLRRKNRMKKDEVLKKGRLLWLRKKRPRHEPIKYKKNPDIETQATAQESKTTLKKGSQGLIPPTDSSILEDPIEEVGALTEDVVEHLIEEGESLYTIARRYDVSVMELARRNNLSVREAIKAGDSLKIYTKKVKKELTEGTGKVKHLLDVHVVEAGDTLYSISRRYNVPVSSLKEWNKKISNALIVGERIHLHPK